MNNTTKQPASTTTATATTTKPTTTPAAPRPETWGDIFDPQEFADYMAGKYDKPTPVATTITTTTTVPAETLGDALGLTAGQPAVTIDATVGVEQGHLTPTGDITAFAAAQSIAALNPGACTECLNIHDAIAALRFPNGKEVYVHS